MFSKYRYPPPPPYIVMSNSLYHLFRTLTGRCVSCMWSVRYLREERWQGKIVPGASSTGSLILYPVPSESSTNCTYVEYPQLQCILIHFSHTTAIPGNCSFPSHPLHPPMFRFTVESPEEAEDGILSVVNPVRWTDYVYWSMSVCLLST